MNFRTQLGKSFPITCAATILLWKQSAELSSRSRRIAMVAQANIEKLARAILTPAPDPTDSDDVAIALQTARALEAQGEMGEAARWLRRAADEAEKEGNDQRVLTFARAAADLASPISGSMPRSVQPPPPKPAPWSVPVSSRPGTQVTPQPPPPPARTSTPPLPPRA